MKNATAVMDKPAARNRGRKNLKSARAPKLGSGVILKNRLAHIERDEREYVKALLDPALKPAPIVIRGKADVQRRQEMTLAGEAPQCPRLCQDVGQSLAFLEGRMRALNGANARSVHASEAFIKEFGRKQAMDLVARRTVLNSAEELKVALANHATRGSVDAQQRIQKIQALIDRARGGDNDSVIELNALRGETVDLYVRAMSRYATLFYEEETLASDQQAYFNLTYRNPVQVRYIGQDGGITSVLTVRAQKQIFFDMKMLTTDDVTYPLRDINLGTDVLEQSRATVDAAWDMENKVDLDAYNLLLTQYGQFNTNPNTPLSQTYIPNPRINLTNLPVTNDLGSTLYFTSGQSKLINSTNTNSGLGAANNTLLADNSTSTLFRLDVLRAIMEYCAAWDDIFGHRMIPTGTILIPSSEVYGVSTELKPTGQFFNPVSQEIVTPHGDYTAFTWFGINWKLVPDVTIPQGICYPVLNMPVGRHFRKPQFDEEFVMTDKRKNIETRAHMQVLQFATLEPWRPRAIRVRYHL